MVKQFLTVQEVAELLRVNRRTVYTWIDEGVIRAVKLHDKSVVRIPMLEIKRIINEALEIPPKPLSEKRKQNIRSRF